jgi:uncharacterized repeat protein (TIGR02543 family)
MKGFSSFLIALALVAGMVGCGEVTPATSYGLTMAVAPSGGGTVTDLTNASPYAEGTSVSIEAASNPGYRFVNWTALAGTFTGVGWPVTTFTMPARNVTVTANFMRVYDLTMVTNPVEQGTVTDLTNASPYAEGASVSIRAVASSGYHFLNWTAPAGIFGDAAAAQTIFTMPGQNVMLTANFATEHSETGELFVSALLEGVSFTAPSTGIYRFTVTGGAFELCPPKSAPERPEWWGWRTEILIYENRPIYWSGGIWAPGHPNPANWDFSVGGPQNQPTYEAAESIGKGMFVDIALAENEYVMLVVNDSRGYFLDNSGGVYFYITVLP